MDRPSDREIHLTLSEFDERQRAELEEALRSERLRWLTLRLDDYDGFSNLGIFLRALENAPGRVKLFGTAADPMFIGQFLNVIASNSKIYALHLFGLVFPAEQLTSLLQVSDSVEALAIHRCQVPETPGLWEADFLKALNENAHIRYLHVSNVDVPYLERILEQLGSHPTLKRLTFVDHEDRPPTPETSNVIRSLLENGTSSTIQVQCHGFGFERESFIPIARGAIDGKLNNGLHIRSCSFDEASTTLFEEMFQPDSNLRCLTVDCSTVSFTKPTQTILSAILHKHSPLEKLIVTNMDSLEGSMRMTAIMNALKVNTSLRSLWIYGVNGEVLEALKNGLPKLRGLECLRCPNLRLDEAQRREMMEAFKRNNSIRVAFDARGAFPDEDDKKKLRLYAARNQNIADLIKNPTRIPLYLWPKVLKTAQDCEYGADTVFRALLGSADRIFIVPEA